MHQQLFTDIIIWICDFCEGSGEIDDVEAHGMSVTWKASAVDKAAVSDAAMANVQDDVEAHALSSTDRLSAIEQRTTFKMNFSNLVGYEVRPEDDEDDVITHRIKWK